VELEVFGELSLQGGVQSNSGAVQGEFNIGTATLNLNRTQQQRTSIGLSVVAPLHQTDSQLNRVDPPRVVELGVVGEQPGRAAVGASALNVIADQVAQKSRGPGDKAGETTRVAVPQIDMDIRRSIEVDEGIHPAYQRDGVAPVVPRRGGLVDRQNIGFTDRHLGGELARGWESLVPEVF